MQPGQRHFGRARQIQVVVVQRVDVPAVGREEARAVHRLLAHQHRRQRRGVPVRVRAVEREAVERHREQRRVAEHEAEARAREPRGALHLEAADLRVLGALGPGIAEAAKLLRVLVGRAVGSGGIRRVRDLCDQRVALPLGFRELGLRHAELLLEPAAAPRAARAWACPSASGGRAARRPVGRARASARRPRAARRIAPRRPCGRVRRGTAPDSRGRRGGRSRA